MRTILIIFLLAAVSLTGAAGVASAQQFPPLSKSQFQEFAPQGFGDRHNSWPWSMAWFNGKLYVGTNRAYFCAFSAAVNILIPVYPPTDPQIECTADPHDLDLAAEIWSWDPATQIWTKVYEAPVDVPIPGSSKLVARDIGYRGMHVFREPSGEDVLYIGSCSPRAIYPGLPPARLLRTADGVNFTAVPRTPGTFLGDLTSACFRGITTHNSRMFLLTGTFRGAGVVISSANPQAGDNSFEQVTPSGASAYEIASFNGFLYVSFNAEMGFQLYKTPGAGAPYSFSTILLNGGYKLPNGNPGALSMKVFKGSLYVGGNSVRAASTAQCAIGVACVDSIIQNGGAELFRINADDTWDLVIGQQRDTPNGLKVPLAGIGPGFSWGLNQHLWRMEVFDGRLYVGTYDVATELRNVPLLGPLMVRVLGFDLWQTADGIDFDAVDLTGFDDPFNYGVRSLLATPAGLFLGAANPYYGLRLYRGVPGP